MTAETNSTGLPGDATISFRDMEAQICDMATAGQVLATIFEDVQSEKVGDSHQFLMTQHEHTMISFLMYDICRRSEALKGQFYRAYGHKAEGSK